MVHRISHTRVLRAIGFAFVCIANTVGCDWVDALRDEPPPAYGGVTERFQVPMTVAALPKDHRISRSDIKLVEMSIDEVKGLATREDLMQLFMASKQIEGRVLLKAKAKDTPFLALELYLEGTEPGAEFEPPDLVDPPWPALNELELLKDEFTSGSNSPDGSNYLRPILLPVVIVPLPEGRVVRSSDIALRQVTLERLRQESLPDFEVMLSPEQIIGRRLRKRKHMGDPYLLSDFVVAGEVETYLRQYIPSLPPSFELTAPKIEPTELPPEPDPIALPELTMPPSPIADDPETLFGPLPPPANDAPVDILP